ncbi:MAG: hypothetical protein WCF92_02790 [bacterium]
MEKTSEIIPYCENRDEKIAKDLDLPLEEWLEMKRQLEEERRTNWAKAKKFLDGMDFYDFINWWYELEIKNAWLWYYCLNDECKARTERKCKHYLKETDHMPGAVAYKLKLSALYKSSNTNLRSILKQMCALRGHAILCGVLLSKRAGECMFNTFEVRILSDVRKEVIRRFVENRVEAATQTTT